MAQLVWKSTPLPTGPNIDTSLTPNETACLQKLATGKEVLEIGSGFGYSAITMAQTAISVLAIDPHAGELANSLPAMRDNLRIHGVEDKVTILQAYSQYALPDLLASGQKFGLVFVDGNHDVQVANDVNYAIELLTPKGHIAVHDAGEDTFPEITRALITREPLKVVDTLWVGRRDAL